MEVQRWKLNVDFVTYTIKLFKKLDYQTRSYLGKVTDYLLKLQLNLHLEMPLLCLAKVSYSEQQAS